MRHLMGLAAGLLILTGCDRSVAPGDAPAAPAPAAGAFSHTATSDLSGYYMPVSEVRIGKWVFDHIFVGQAFEFEAWKGVESGTTFAPVMLQFDDATSPRGETELGEARSVTARVLPTRYAVAEDRLIFEGTSAELGVVRFEGRIAQGALATSRRNLGAEGVVVTGALTAAGQTVRDVRLRWWMGD